MYRILSSGRSLSKELSMSRLVAAFLLTLMLAVPAYAADPAPAAAPAASSAAAFTDAQKTELEKIIRETLEKNPEIIMNAAQAYQTKQAAEADKKAAEAVVKNQDKLFNNPKDGIDGNPKGTIQIVEFFDYNCGFCKKAHEPLKELLKTEKDVKVVYKQLPILAESSRTAAKAVLAAGMQGKYVAMHDAVLDHKGAIDEAALMSIAEKAGVNKDKMKKDMEGPDVAAQLAASIELGNEIGARGTPTFVFGDKLVPGAMSLDEMKKIIGEMRAKKS
jgi:protein-disulfide isomerase